MDAPLGVWSIIVEFTLPVTEEDIAVRYEGDAECDFASRAVERLRPKLNEMTDGGKAMGYYLMPQTPRGELPSSVPAHWMAARRCSG